LVGLLGIMQDAIVDIRMGVGQQKNTGH